jgi:hypothetical protein
MNARKQTTARCFRVFSIRGAAIHAFMLLLFVVATAAPGWAGAVLTGKGSFDFPDSLGEPDRPIVIWFYRPAMLKPDAKIVFVMHGANRNGETYRNQWVEHAKRENFLLLAPEFPDDLFPSADYQFGGLRHPDPATWTYWKIERLFDHVKASEGLTAARYSIFGHSAGAQFVHRFMLFMPDPRVALAIAANAGSYTLPIYPQRGDPKFPWSLDRALVDSRQLRSVFAQNLLVLLGEEDDDRDHPQLPRSRKAGMLGENRLKRGVNFYNLAKDHAAARGLPFNWTLATVPGVAHKGASMAKAAVPYIVNARD